MKLKKTNKIMKTFNGGTMAIGGKSKLRQVSNSMIIELDSFERIIYKVGNHFVSSENSTEAILKLKRLQMIKHTTGVEKICNTSLIELSEQSDNNMLLKVSGNKIESEDLHEIFISAPSVESAFIKFKSIHPESMRLQSTFVCFVNDVV